MTSKTMFNPTIIVVAYNRPHSLKRLLFSLAKANYPQNVTLIISIDKGDNQDVLSVANNFSWPHGNKITQCQAERQGLRNHILKCGDLSQEYGPIILLEDDLYVSPIFYTFASKALEFYQDEKQIAGISLYTHHFNVLARLPFKPLDDDADVFFLQIASSWGKAWNSHQWNSFREWYSKNNGKISVHENIPQKVISWPDSSWLKYFINYMVATNKYFVYPRESFTTNFSDPGTHLKIKLKQFQVPLQCFKTDFKFKKLNDSLSVYDAYFELLPDRLNKLTNILHNYNYEIDLYGSKSINKIKSKYILTLKMSKDYVLRFGSEMKPMEMNIIQNIPGNNIYLCRGNSICQGIRSSMKKTKTELFYYSPDIPASKLFLLLLLKIMNKVSIYFIALKRYFLR